MRLLREVTQDHMVLVFLQAEITSPRFRHLVLAELKRLGCGETLITQPDMGNPHELELRRQALEYRGYWSRTGAFTDFPKDIVWRYVELTLDEVASIRFANMTFWNNLSEGQRRAPIAAETIRTGRGFHRFNQWDRQAIQGIRHIASVYDRGETVPPVILLAPSPDGPLMITEGYSRMTAWFLADSDRRRPLQFLLGTSPGFSWISWS